MSHFERHDRYTVIKHNKLKSYHQLHNLMNNWNNYAVDCVVVESDWPEYEKVWKMIEQRVTGTTPNVDQVALDCMQRIMYILDADWKGGEPELKAQIQCAIIDALDTIK